MNYLKITLEQLLSILSCRVDVQVRDRNTNKVIIYSLHSLRRSKDKRSIIKWNFYKDVEICTIHPEIRLPKNKCDYGFCTAILEAYIDTDDHMRVEKAIKEMKESSK